MRIVVLWLLCKMWKGRVVWLGLDFDRRVGIENNVYRQRCELLPRCENSRVESKTVLF